MSAPPHSVHRPRVVIFRSILLPASETFIREQAEALRRFEPVYAGLKPEQPGPPHSSRSLLLASPGARLSSLKTFLYQVSGYSPSFISRIKDVRPSLIHAHFALDGVAALPIARQLNIPLIVSLHGYDVTSSDKSLRTSTTGMSYVLRRRQLWDRAHTFLCVSDFIREQAIEAGFPRKKLRVHYTGVDCNHFSRTDAPRDGGVLFVGRLVQKKGCQFLLQAMAEVNKALPGTSLTVIGDGPLRSSLQAQADQLKIPVHFLGTLPTSQVRDSMSRASIFCVPSLRADNGDSEGFGMVFAEAQAMGTPVVSFLHGGIPEAVQDGRTGLLVPERDTPALAVAIMQLLRDATLWSSFSEQGPPRIRDKYSLETQTQALEDIYTAACASSSDGQQGSA